MEIDELKKLLRYEPETGKIFFKKRSVEDFETERAYKIFKTRFEGKQTFNTKHSYGYLVGTIKSKSLRAHIVAFALHYGKWPTKDIDHINGIKTDNRIQNLRESTAQENAKNKFISPRNTSGINGVSWHKNRKKWIAQIKIDGKMKYLGGFDDIMEAAKVRKQADKENGFTERHGCKPEDNPTDLPIPYLCNRCGKIDTLDLFGKCRGCKLFLREE